MLQQLVGHAAGAALEARLQRPDFAHVGGDAVLDRELVFLCVDHNRHGLEQGRHRMFTTCLEFGPFSQHLMPQQRGEQKAGRHAAALIDALVGAL